ncbi:hypothetical protein A9404_03530 [Halothiobacillus diazotrophicus]|uniref:DUF6868 domain-containing protein n=2 Tax=Halothiobacillus diazotrophicus TaxID=1860122 RepID=A0A191ZFB8_9GAMM|nr:hypothetical protein A9404_03530 [Halothiobacillus diazotrophicus]
MSMTELTTFLGWCTLINTVLLFVAFLMLSLARKRIMTIHARIFQVPEEALPGIYLGFLGKYKLLIVVFNLVPYLALRLMGH